MAVPEKKQTKSGFGQSFIKYMSSILKGVQMKEKLTKALFTAVVTALGITFVMLMKGDSFSLFKTGLYAVTAFTADYIFSYIFDKEKK